MLEMVSKTALMTRLGRLTCRASFDVAAASAGGGATSSVQGWSGDSPRQPSASATEPIAMLNNEEPPGRPVAEAMQMAGSAAVPLESWA